MSEQNRVLRPASIEQIVKHLADERKWMLSRFESTMGMTVGFAQKAATAVGDISTQECIEAIIQFFSDEMRRVK